MLNIAIIHIVTLTELTLYTFLCVALLKKTPNEKLNKASGNRFIFSGAFNRPHRIHKIILQQNTIYGVNLLRQELSTRAYTDSHKNRIKRNHIGAFQQTLPCKIKNLSTTSCKSCVKKSSTNADRRFQSKNGTRRVLTFLRR